MLQNEQLDVVRELRGLGFSEITITSDNCVMTRNVDRLPEWASVCVWAEVEKVEGGTSVEIERTTGGNSRRLANITFKPSDNWRELLAACVKFMM